MNQRESEALRLRADIFKALGHPTRLWIVEQLSEGERCVADLVEGVEEGFSAVSQHLGVLRQAGILKDERRGKQIYYSLTFPCISELSALLGAKIPDKKRSRLIQLRRALAVLLLFVMGYGLSLAVRAPGNGAAQTTLGSSRAEPCGQRTRGIEKRGVGNNEECNTGGRAAVLGGGFCQRLSERQLSGKGYGRKDGGLRKQSRGQKRRMQERG
ncbi:MAG: metalloregulator ArsR/SmtB family transcription factor [Kiritimatiellia bacterium]